MYLIKKQHVESIIYLFCSGALCWCSAASASPPSLHSVISLVDGLSIKQNEAERGIPLAVLDPSLRPYWLLYMSIISGSLVMSHLVTPFLLGSSRVQKRRIRFSTGTSNGTSYIHLFELSDKRDTCLSITLTKCRQKTWTRTRRLTTRTKNRWVFWLLCLDVVG